ncbi:hypothetical protein HYT54_00600 [Candidatus Woesearchaeota archaeon]|nr:hypothetical protein [Candidatus Woesearchaeota archaeon]
MKLNSLETRRQVFHLFFGISIAALFHYNILNSIIIIIFIGLALSFIGRKIHLPVWSWLLSKLEREKDMKRFPGKGAIFYLIGCFIAISLFPKDIATASILILAFGDSVSHLSGLHYGSVRNPLNKKKFLEGALFGFVSALIPSLMLLRPAEAFAGSLAAMAIEAIEIKLGADMIDDNLTIPVGAGIAIYAVRILI